MIEVYLPAFDPSHESSTLLEWTVKEGDAVRAGDPVCEVTTDKVTMEVEAPGDGTITRFLFKADDEVPTNTVIAYLLEKGETEAVLPTQSRPPEERENVTPTPAHSSSALQTAETSTLQRPGNLALEQAAATSGRSAGKAYAVPNARRLAREGGVGLLSLTGTGPAQRIQGRDVLAAQAAPKAPDTPPEALSAPGLPTVPVPEGAVLEPLSPTRRTTARRSQASYQNAPHFFVEMEANAGKVTELRAGLKRRGPVSVTSVVLKACAWALGRHPRLNATFQHDTLELWPSINIGVAVAREDGLIVPVVREVGRGSLGYVQEESCRLIDRARADTLSPEDVAGGTFTVSNLGMMGVERFTAIINPPQVAILAVGRTKQTFVPDEAGQPALRSTMSLTLSSDHRVIDGAEAALFLRDVRDALEDPHTLVFL